MKRIIVISVVLLCLIKLAPGARAQQQGEVKLRLFAPAWRNIGDQRPQDVARRFTVIYGHLPPGPFHEGNANCKCLKYTLGPYVTKRMLEILPSEAFVHDSDGNVIKARDWANWIIVPDNPRWLAHVTSRARRLLDSEFDGLFIDSMGPAPVSGGYLLATPTNPNTGRPYTKRQWLAAGATMLKAIREAIPKDKLLTLNGLKDGVMYWSEPVEESPRALIGHVDGAMSEAIWRKAKAPLNQWPTPRQWMLDVRMVQDIERRGLMGFWWTKCWSDGNTSAGEPNADVLVPQWRRFALASYLLAAGPRSYFNFDTRKLDNNAAEVFPEYDAPLGTTREAMQQIGDTGIYARRFSGGFVLVNPTGRPVNISRLPWAKARGDAPGNNRWISCGEDRTVTLPLSVDAHTGMILIKPQVR